MPSLPLVAELHRFSMIFWLSSGCCSSLRWKKGKRKTQEEDEEIKEGSQVEETTTIWMAMIMVVCGVWTLLELEPNVSVMKCA